MSQITIFHNPRCSKSRQTLQLLNDNGITPHVIEYLKSGLDHGQIESLKNALNVDSFRDFMRTKEDEYKQQNLAQASEQELAAALVNTPKLLERPIVVKGDNARIGRPPEQVMSILS